MKSLALAQVGVFTISIRDDSVIISTARGAARFQEPPLVSTEKRM